MCLDTGVISRTRHRDSIWWDGRQGQTDWINLHSHPSTPPAPPPPVPCTVLCLILAMIDGLCIMFSDGSNSVIAELSRWWPSDGPVSTTSAASSDAKAGRCVIAFLPVQDWDDDTVGAVQLKYCDQISTKLIITKLQHLESWSKICLFRTSHTF